jgi:hypothetical protein
MALATSGTINLTDIRDFYGLSGSINLTNLHKGENGVPDPATYAVSNFTQMNAASAPAFPLAVYDNGGVVPSLDTEANQNIPTSGSIDLTDYYGAYKIVNPTVSSVSLSSQASSSGYWGGTTMEPGSRKGFYGSNYADATGTSGYNDNYAQLVSVAASAWLGSTFSAHAEITFQVSHTGIYSLYGLHIANGASNGGLMTINGSGVSIKDQSGSSVTAGSNLDLTANSAGRFFEVTLPASTTITLRAVTVSGSGGSWLLAQLRTNCNHQRGDNSDNSSSTTNNNMLTQG